MQTAMLPLSVCDEVDKMCRGFIWGDTEAQRKIHLVAWDDLCIPKSHGGLGLIDMRKVNKASAMKAGWRLCTRRDDMWVQVVRSKYRCRNDLIPRIQGNRPGSNFWQGICKSWNEVQSNLVWRVGDGNRAKFWCDHWIPEINNLQSHATRVVSLSDMTKTVKDYVKQDGNWDFQSLNLMLPSHIMAKIRAMKPPEEGHEEDKLAWDDCSDSSFTMAAAYRSISCDQSQETHPIFQQVWRWGVPERIRIFLWKIVKGALLTNEQHFHRGMGHNPLCPRCGMTIESVDHVLKSCNFAKEVWQHIRSGPLDHQFWNSNLTE